MQASNTPPDHPPGRASKPISCRPAKSGGSAIIKNNPLSSSASGIPGGAFFMHFCAFWLLQKSNTRCNVNLMFAKSLFSEICTQKEHFAQLGPSWGAYPPGRKVLRSGCAGLHPAAKVETLPKSNGHPLPESRMILHEKISGKVELGLYYALLFHDSGVHPTFLLILHVVLLQARAFQPKSDRVQGFAADKVERIRSRIGLKVG